MIVLLRCRNHAAGRQFRMPEPWRPVLVHLVGTPGKDAEMVVKKSNGESRVVKGQELEVQHVTEVTDLSPKQARSLLRKHGADWPKLKDEAENLKEED